MGTAVPLIRIVVAEEHAIVREGLRCLLEAKAGFRVIGEAGDAATTVRVTRELKPDILLLEAAMPGGGGVAALEQLTDIAASGVRPVLLTAAIETAEVVRALRFGARGVVLKAASSVLLYRALHAVNAGEIWVGREHFSGLIDSLQEPQSKGGADQRPASMLTTKERLVIGEIAQGATNKDIATKLGLSEQTVKNHLSSIFNKLGVSNRLELALYAVSHRLLRDGG